MVETQIMIIRRKVKMCDKQIYKMGEVVAFGGYCFALFLLHITFALTKISTYSWRKTKEKQR